MSASTFTSGLPSSAPQYLYPSLESLPKPPFYDSLPSTGAEARSRADQSQGYGATGKSMPYVSIGVRIVPYAGSYAFVKQPTDGQLVFSNPRKGLMGNELAVLTIDSLNAVLKNGWEEGIAALSSTSALYTPTEAAILRRISTSRWSQIEFVKRKWDTATTDAELGIAFLSLELFADNYVRAGWVRGIQFQPGYSQDTTIRTTGSVESVENIWGDNILTGDRLWLILKRVWDDVAGKWGHFAYIPWAGRGEDPSFNDVTYLSFSGHPSVGRAYYIGTVETWMEHVHINDDALPEYLSMTTGIMAGSRERQPNCLRITYNGRPHTKLPFMIC